MRRSQANHPLQFLQPLGPVAAGVAAGTADHQTAHAVADHYRLDDAEILAQPGDVIRVRNVGSGKVIDAKVLESGVVTSTF